MAAAVLCGMPPKVSVVFLSPLRGFGRFPNITHSLRCGLHSYAASRLASDRFFCPHSLEGYGLGSLRIKAGNFRTRDLRAAFCWLLYNPR